jgi:F-type H+-transporting ATPase subunit b
MHIDGWTLALQTINALILIGLLGRFLFRPVAQILAQRRAEAAGLLAQAEQARAQAQQARLEIERQAADLAAHRDEALAEAESDVERTRAQALDRLTQELAQRRAQAQAEIEAQRHQETARNQASARALALDLAGKLLERLPDGARVEGYLDGVVDALTGLPAAARATLATPAAPLTVTSVVALKERQRQVCSAHIETALGHAAQLEWRVEPALLAGIECESAQWAVRNSVRHDLDQLNLALANDESILSSIGHT